ncbi:MAG: hypothetical protein ABI759_20205 [Candidatus Solibacter sp.]
MRISAYLMALALLAPVVAVHAQESETATYKVDFTIRDTGDAGGKAGRKYTLMVNRNVKSSFKIGNRVPIATGASSTGVAANTQFTYIDVGLNIDCLVAERGPKIAMHADLDVSTAVMPEKTSAVPNPTISSIRLNIDTTVDPSKPTVIASFDDPVTGRKFDVEVAISKI